MSNPIITDITPKTANVGDIGVSITGTDLTGTTSLVLKLIQPDITYDITSFITSSRYSEIRFKTPNFVSGRYYLQVVTDGVPSNVF